jgi:hypothetical protein
MEKIIDIKTRKKITIKDKAKRLKEIYTYINKMKEARYSEVSWVINKTPDHIRYSKDFLLEAFKIDGDHVHFGFYLYKILDKFKSDKTFICQLIKNLPTRKNTDVINWYLKSDNILNKDFDITCVVIDHYIKIINIRLLGSEAPFVNLCYTSLKRIAFFLKNDLQNEDSKQQILKEIEELLSVFIKQPEKARVKKWSFSDIHEVAKISYISIQCYDLLEHISELLEVTN